MKQLLIVVLTLMSFGAFSQTLTVVKNGNTTIFYRSGQEAIVVGASEYFDCVRSSADTVSIVITHSRMNNSIYHKTKVLSVGGVSTTGVGAWEIARRIKDLISSLNVSASASGASPALATDGSRESKQDVQIAIGYKLATKGRIDSLYAQSLITNRRLDSLKIIGLARTKPADLQKVDSTTFRSSVRVSNPYLVLASDSVKSRFSMRVTNPYLVLASDSVKYRSSVRVSNPQVNQTLVTAGFAKITDGTSMVAVKASGVASANADIAFVVTERPSTALFGANVPTVTAYTTASNTVSTTNCIRVLVENQSTTTNGTIAYGGQIIILGYKGNSTGYSNFYAFDAPYDVNSKKYSPFASMVIDGASSNIYVTKIFAQ